MDFERNPTSRLARLLRDARRARPRAMGFGRGRDESAAPAAMVLIVEIDGLDAEAAASTARAGVAGVAFRIDDAVAASLGGGDVRSLTAAVKACGETISGVSFGGEQPLPSGALAALADAGVDFLVAPVHRAPAAVLAEERVARVPVVRPSQPAGLLRALSEMNVDIIAVSAPRRRGGRAELTVSDLMSYRQLADVVRQPVVMLEEQTVVQPGDLQALRNVGVEGVILPLPRLGADLAAAVGALGGYVEAIANVKVPKASGRGEGPAVMLPRPQAAQPGGEDGGEDDEED